MRYNILIDTPPDEFGGVPIKTDFRQVLEFFRCISDTEKSEQEKAAQVINIFFDEPPKFGGEELWDFIEWYISLGDTKSAVNGKKIFDWDVDSGRVYAAFWQAYRLDLTKEELHWWTFKTLFDALPSGSRLMEVIDIRQKPMPVGTDRESGRARLALQRLKSKFALE